MPSGTRSNRPQPASGPGHGNGRAPPCACLPDHAQGILTGVTPFPATAVTNPVHAVHRDSSVTPCPGAATKPFTPSLTHTTTGDHRGSAKEGHLTPSMLHGRKLKFCSIISRTDRRRSIRSRPRNANPNQDRSHPAPRTRTIMLYPTAVAGYKPTGKARNPHGSALVLDPVAAS